MTEKNQVLDKSNDRKYFIQVPQLVLALCRTPYDYTLWNVIKMVAGDSGECKLTTDDLASLSMMSTGKVSDCRAYLIEAGLLEGSCYKEPGYPQPVWHLRIPDIWLENITWRKVYDSLKDRVELKKRLRKIFTEAGVLRNFDKEKRNADTLRNVNVNSLHNMKPSQYEEGPPQNEEGPPQNETKNNQKEKTIDITGVDPNLQTLSTYWQTRIGGINGTMADKFKDWLSDYSLGLLMNAIDLAVDQNKRGKVSTAFVDAIIKRLANRQETIEPHPLQEPFTELTNLKPPLDGKEAERWHKEFAEIQHISGGPELAQRYMRLARDELTTAGFTVSWPGSLTKTIRRLQSQQTQNGHGFVAKVKY